MPKRIVDGDALWRSDKLGLVQPPRLRAEYANLIPLALANGTFEVAPRRIWATVYSYNRPDMSEADVAVMLAEFERIKLLFRWIDTATGKLWGYWIGIDKPGRLPGKSRWGRNEAMGPEPPLQELRKFLESNGIQSLPFGSKKLPSGSELLPGFGLGIGERRGNGSGRHASTERSHSRGAADPRHAPIRQLIQELHVKNFQVQCVWDGSEGKALDSLLKSNPTWTEDQLAAMVRNRFASEAVNGARPRKWLPNLSDYATGPLDRYGKLIARNSNVTNRAEREEQQTHDAIERAARRFVARHSAREVDGVGKSNVIKATAD